MPTENPRVTITLDDDLLNQITEYKFENRLKNQTQAILSLIEKGMKKLSNEDENEGEPEQEPDIKNYHDLDDHGKKIVDMVIKEEFDRMEREATLKCCADIVTLDYFDLPASAGFGLPLEGEYRTIIEVPKNELTKKADFAIRVAGDSMEPDYFDGDIVLVKKGEVHKGDVGIFVLDGESYVKELGKDALISRNKKYLDISLNGVINIFVAGKVIGKL